MTPACSGWVRGFGLALAEVYRLAGDITAVREAARNAALDLDDFRTAGLDPYDLKDLRRAGVPTRKQSDAEHRRFAARVKRTLREARR